MFGISHCLKATKPQLLDFFFQAHNQSRIDYASTLWDSSSESLLKPLKSLHRRAVKIILLKNTRLTNYDFKKTTILPLKHRLIYVQRKGGGRNKKEKSRNRFCVAVCWIAFLPRNMRKTTINFCFANCSWHQKGRRSG